MGVILLPTLVVEGCAFKWSFITGGQPDLLIHRSSIEFDDMTYGDGESGIPLIVCS